MTPRNSKLLLNKMILPEKCAATFQAILDMTMMAFNAGMVRTEQQWTQLLKKAGLEVVKFWQPMREDADGVVNVMFKA